MLKGLSGGLYATMNFMPKEKATNISSSKTLKTKLSREPVDSPFSIKFSLFLAFMVSFLLPLVIFSPLIIAKASNLPLAEYIGMTKDNFGLFVIISQTIGLIITLILIITKLKGRDLSWSMVGLKKFKIFQAIRYVTGYYLIILGVLIALAIVASSLGIEPPATADGETGGTSLLKFMGNFWLAFALTVILAPIIEEIVFRGVLFPVIRKRYGLISGVIISSLIFTLVHIDPINMISVLPLGIFLAIMYHRTGSIYPGMVLHASWNFMVLLIAQSAS